MTTTTKRTGTSTVRQMTMMSLQYMRGRKLRTVLTTISIVFGVALIFAFNIALPSAIEAFKRSITAATGAVDLNVRSVTGETFSPEETLGIVTSVPGVKAVSGVLRRQVSLPQLNFGAESAVGSAPQIELVGIDPVTAPLVRDVVMSEGEFLQPGDTGKALLTAGIADLAPELKIGTTFPLITAGGLRLYTVSGLTAEQGSATAPTITVTLSDAQTVLSQPGLINGIEVAFEAGADPAAVTTAVQEALGSGYVMNSTSSGGLDAVGSMQVAFAMFNVLAALALFMGAFLIFNTFRTILIERQRDMGMLRAIGATRRQMTQMILIESLLQGIIGTLAGMALGFVLITGLAGVVNTAISRFMNLQVDLTVSPQAIVGATAAGMITALAAGYFPARAAARVTPLEALRPAPVSSVRQANRRGFIVGMALITLALLTFLSGNARGAAGGAVLFLVGLIVAAPALVVPAARLFSPLLALWYAREGDIARSNMVRQPGRAAITASTLMIGLATLVLLVSIVKSMDGMISRLVDRNFSSDLMLIPPTIAVYDAVVGGDESLSERIRAIPAVETAAGLRYATSNINGKALQVLGIDPVNYPQVAQLEFSAGTPDEAFSEMNAGRYAIVNGLSSIALNVQVGDTFTLETAEGPQTYQVAGIANDVLSFKVNAIFISTENLKADFHKAEDVLMMINLKEGEDKNAALAAVQEVLKDYPQFTAVITGEYRDEMMQLIGGAMQFFYILALIILIPATLGLLNTLTINVLERTREIGVVRAVGGSRTQIQRMVTAESLLLGLFGAATGVLAGVAMSYGFTAAFAVIGWDLPYEIPVIGMIAAVILAVLLALFASILPARSAARLDIIRALQYE
jgi:putative ABC transport system permease protein